MQVIFHLHHKSLNCFLPGNQFRCRFVLSSCLASENFDLREKIENLNDNVIPQLQERIYNEKMQNTEIEADLRNELDRLAKICSEQQQLMHLAINKAPANTTEACLQHEITRLTSENFDLREKIENLNDNIRR